MPTFNELYKEAQEKKVIGYAHMRKPQLIEALKNPEEYNKRVLAERHEKRMGFKPFDLSAIEPKKGHYIKWHSVYMRYACEGKFIGYRDDGRVIVSWFWDNHWVKGTIAPRFVINYKPIPAEQVLFRGL